VKPKSPEGVISTQNKLVVTKDEARSSQKKKDPELTAMEAVVFDNMRRMQKDQQEAFEVSRKASGILESFVVKDNFLIQMGIKPLPQTREIRMAVRETPRGNHWKQVRTWWWMIAPMKEGIPS
ncbi:hypothetical protein S245_003289, partial [Arachis hypogaea]